MGLIFTPCSAEEFSDIGCEALGRGKFHFCRRPFVAVLAPAALSLEATTAPTRLIASSRPCVYVCVYIFLEPIKTLRFPNFFLRFQTRNILLHTHAHTYINRAGPMQVS